MEAGKGISLWEWGNNLMKKEGEMLAGFYADRKKTVIEFFDKLHSLELTLSEAETIFEQVAAIKAGLNLLPSRYNSWLNFHFEGNPEKAEKIRREYIEDVALLMELCQSKINLLGLSQKNGFKEGAISPTKKTKIKYKTFKDLFKKDYRDHCDKFNEILREVTPELINADGSWIGAKGAARLFVEALKVEAVIYPDISREKVYEHFSDHFPNLGKSFMKKPDKETYANDHYNDFPERIQKIKAQISTK